MLHRLFLPIDDRPVPPVEFDLMHQVLYQILLCTSVIALTYSPFHRPILMVDRVLIVCDSWTVRERNDSGFAVSRNRRPYVSIL